MRKKSKGERVIRASAMFTAAIIVVAVFIIGIAPVSAAIASVTRDLPLIVDTNEEFDVTLTQTGFFMGSGTVDETLPDGFEYVAGSCNAHGDVEYSATTRELTIDFRRDGDVSYRVKASSYPQLLAVFEGTYYTIVLSDPIEPESGPVGGRSGVIVGSSTSGSVSGTIHEVDGSILPSATVELFKDTTRIDFDTTDVDGNYMVSASETGDYTVAVSKAGYVSETQGISITAVSGEYTLDFVNDDAIVPEDPGFNYVLDCIWRWKGEGTIGFDKILDVIFYWKS
jgi:hypothetical protein